MSILDVILKVLLGQKMHKMRLQRPDSRWDVLKFVCEAKNAKTINWLKTMRLLRFLDTERHDKLKN